ncbi:MAG: VTT domain-containing protein [Gemmataceae bacterium]
MESLTWALGFLREINNQLIVLANENPTLFYVVIFAIIFAETGLIIAPFLPGDSLLFAVGAILAVSGELSLPFTLGLLIVAAILGDAVNYSVGAWTGPKIFHAERSWLFNRNHLLKAQSFYERYGAKTIILARFVPIVRTFAPFVAGIARMRYPRFALYNVLGGLFWVVSCTLAGYWFGSWEVVKNHFELVVVAIVLISVLPMALEFLLGTRPAKPLESTGPMPTTKPNSEAA